MKYDWRDWLLFGSLYGRLPSNIGELLNTIETIHGELNVCDLSYKKRLLADWANEHGLITNGERIDIISAQPHFS